MKSERDDDQPWRALAHRGQLSITVLTKARAEQDGIAMNRDAALVVVLHPDDGESVPVGCTSIESVLHFMRQMDPRRVAVLAATFEDAAPLVALLERADKSLH